jgi:hypothetical protein
MTSRPSPGWRSVSTSTGARRGAAPLRAQPSSGPTAALVGAQRLRHRASSRRPPRRGPAGLRRRTGGESGAPRPPRAHGGRPCGPGRRRERARSRKPRARVGPRLFNRGFSRDGWLSDRRYQRLAGRPDEQSRAARAPTTCRRRLRRSRMSVAERQGFEPWVGSPPQRFSRPPRSTTPAPLRLTFRQTERPGFSRGFFVQTYAAFSRVFICA